MIPVLKRIGKTEFLDTKGIYRIIQNDDSRYFGYFELNNVRYYVSWFSEEPVKVDFKYLTQERWLLIGIDLKIVVLCAQSGSVLLSQGLFSFFQGFSNNNSLSFTIYSELEDIVINKKGMSIQEIRHHDLRF